MKNIGFKRIVLFGAFILCLVNGVRADGLEYRYELGVMGGMSGYYGDANYHVPFKNINAMGGEKAIELYNEFNKKLNNYVNVEKGIFGADMKVSIINDGPVTIMLESR